jgi:hypothetical protein
MKPDTTVLYLADDITLLHTLVPFLRSAHRRRFWFTSSLDDALAPSARQNIILIRFYKRRDIASDPEIFRALRERYRRIVYFDDTATADEINAVALKFCDFYGKKQLRRDRSSYSLSLYGKRAYTDYYHRFHGASEAEPVFREPLSPEAIEHIDLTWNLGVGLVPRSRLRRALAFRFERHLGAHHLRYLYRNLPPLPSLTHRRDCISARFGFRFGTSVVGYHRELFQKAIEGRPHYLTGTTSLREFNRELERCRGVLSPFGWGEICFRDFEGISRGAVLIKPSMDHIETWPDLYIPGETYLPVNWDASDLDIAESAIKNDPKYCTRLAQQAYNTYREAFDQAPRRADALFEKWLA